MSNFLRNDYVDAIFTAFERKVVVQKCSLNESNLIFNNFVECDLWGGWHIGVVRDEHVF